MRGPPWSRASSERTASSRGFPRRSRRRRMHRSRPGRLSDHAEAEAHQETGQEFELRERAPFVGSSGRRSSLPPQCGRQLMRFSNVVDDDLIVARNRLHQDGAEVADDLLDLRRDPGSNIPSGRLIKQRHGSGRCLCGSREGDRTGPSGSCPGARPTALGPILSRPRPRPRSQTSARRRAMPCPEGWPLGRRAPLPRGAPSPWLPPPRTRPRRQASDGGSFRSRPVAGRLQERR